MTLPSFLWTFRDLLTSYHMAIAGPPTYQKQHAKACQLIHTSLKKTSKNLTRIEAFTHSASVLHSAQMADQSLGAWPMAFFWAALSKIQQLSGALHVRVVARRELALCHNSLLCPHTLGPCPWAQGLPPALPGSKVSQLWHIWRTPAIQLYYYIETWFRRGHSEDFGVPFQNCYECTLWRAARCHPNWHMTSYWLEEPHGLLQGYGSLGSDIDMAFQGGRVVFWRDRLLKTVIALLQLTWKNRVQLNKCSTTFVTKLEKPCSWAIWLCGRLHGLPTRYIASFGASTSWHLETMCSSWEVKLLFEGRHSHL